MKRIILLASLIAAPAMADTIAEAKAKAPKSTVVTTASREKVVRCIRTSRAFDGMAINEVANDDGSIDVATAMQGYRFALWSIHPREGTTTVEGRAMYGGRKLVLDGLRECYEAK